MSDILTKKILVLGSRWGGKSLLIKRLEEMCSSSKLINDEFLYTTATIGKTLTVIKNKRHQSFELHELGATLGCLWKTFYMSTHFDKIIYVIDSTQPWSISFTFEQLKEICEQIPIKPKNILLVFNKTNEINSLNRTALIELLDLDSIWKGEVEIIETNARTGTNLSSLLDWLTH
ncbi:unnamed protein product [Rotaria sp. Silwood1]|nr:unnamed protein product [Rotaria sp. Silwood1]CAF0745928.1 unnamed protein product [Rotaria sp. Silwood1]CAF3356339.1 unnamed protein product [Rotaria sp. Silwood1]CAF4509659.1 unnamed protein product [Rotaria sp. Silwood1]